MAAQRASAQRGVETGTAARKVIRDLLQAIGVEQEPHESLAETTARALGITCEELRTRLRAGRLFA